MYIDSVGPLLRLDFAQWGFISSERVRMDGHEITDDRVHYILKSIVREVFVLPVGSDVQEFILVTSDRDPTQGKYQCVAYKGTKQQIRDLEKAFQVAMTSN
jgi:hypothetical protein